MRLLWFSVIVLLCSLAWATDADDDDTLVSSNSMPQSKSGPQQAITRLKDESFLTELQESRFVLVDYYSASCPPCTTLGRLWKAVNKTLAEDDVRVVKVDVGQQNLIAYTFSVWELPTVQMIDTEEHLVYDFPMNIDPRKMGKDLPGADEFVLFALGAYKEVAEPRSWGPPSLLGQVLAPTVTPLMQEFTNVRRNFEQVWQSYPTTVQVIFMCGFSTGMIVSTLMYMTVQPRYQWDQTRGLVRANPPARRTRDVQPERSPASTQEPSTQGEESKKEK